ncbi:MAG: DUF177 domain-containing protein [Gammaproteobacteria bacterium]
MSVALTDSIDLKREAARGRHLTQTVSLAQLPRLVEAFGLPDVALEDASPLDCDLELSCTEDGMVRVRGEVGITARLVCQRCLGSYDYPLALKVAWRSGALPHGDFELNDEPVRLIEWVEDEVLLALPSIPKHVDRSQCGTGTQKYMTDSEVEKVPMRTPFADLKNMLEANSDSDD